MFFAPPDTLESLPPPMLVALSKTNQSVALEWAAESTIPLELEELNFQLQKVVLGLAGEWTYHSDVLWTSRQRLEVLGLRPFTTYKVRYILNRRSKC